MTRRTGYSLLGLLMAAMTILSCTTILGIDTESDENPCSAGDLPPLECGVGACRTIRPACVNGLPMTCPPVDSQADEICDGIDNNCDGLIDEGCPCMEGAVQSCYSGAPLTRNVGICITGIQTCTNGIWLDCTGEVLPGLENCDDNFDNDCNGKVNDNCACTEGQTRKCYGGPPISQGVANCKEGDQTCLNGFWGDCKADVIPGGEVCDGVDNNCDGAIDEISGCECSGDQTKECYTGDDKFVGIGVCKKGYYPCKGGKFDETKCLTEVLPGAEVCNGLDDDCNGLPDDAMGLGLDCTTKLPGICKFGKTDCGIDEETGKPGTICTPDVKPFQNPEQGCNLVDDNCDGVIDEGVLCCPEDGIQNGSETDVNCGGTCVIKCPDGKKCNTGDDCVSQVCVSGICVGDTCDDATENGTETDVDCGGSACPGCQPTKNCEYGSDCLSNVCVGGKCQAPTCFDGVENGNESDKDCGDACKPLLCVNLQNCNSALDCVSLSCKDKVCQAATCGDTTKNGSETDIDCGGGQCQGCGTGQGCNVGADCKEKVCGANKTCLAPTCTDSAANGQETDVNCGGPDCVARCDTGQKCLVATDCQSKICTNNICAPSQCTDFVQNGTETDVDCGGGCPEKCDPSEKCKTNVDCKSDVCTGGICLSPTCSDNKKNGAETDLDCGGPCVQEQKKCSDGKQCQFAGDCQSGVCTGGICVPAQCNDQTKNGNETDIDCGGGLPCQACDIGKNCLNAIDCKTNICSAGKCAPKPIGEFCLSALECASGNCVDGFCCNSSCDGTCFACSAAKKGQGNNGFCQAIVGNADPDNECASDNPSSCGNTGFCNGAGACAKYSNSVECVVATCKDITTAKLPQFCNGNGACLTSAEQSCVPYTCSAGQCNTSCAIDAQCAGGYYCNNSQCIPKGTISSSCQTNNQCASGNCVDGVCCDSACTGTCYACSAGKKGQGSDGICGPVVNNGDPDNECATTSIASCGTTGVCDGTGKCALHPNGAPCAAAECLNATTLSPSSTCNGSGTCTATSQISCAPYLCKNNACSSTCVGDVDCATGNYCLLSSCQAKKADGNSCIGNNECANGNCVDGVCCNNACTGLCQACSAGKKGSGADGTCGPIANGQDPDNDCMDGQCADSTTLNVTQVCNGAGACKAGVTASCTPYVCAPGVSCPTTCTSDANCASTHYCNASNQCVSKKATGQTCTNPTGNECTSGNCVDGYCCNEACAGTCRACSIAAGAATNGSCANIQNGGTDANPVCGGLNTCDGGGVCKKALGQACGVGSDCSSGFCADGVCCNEACGGTCRACTLAKKGAGTDGQCGNIASGSTDDAPVCGGANVCDGTGACKKKMGEACVVGTECVSGSCVDGVCCSSGSCSTCQTCNKNIMTAGTCQNINAGTTDNNPVGACTGTNTCDGSGTCKKNDGQVCGNASECLSGNCVDGVCCNGTCTGECQACSVAAGAATNGVCGNITSGQPDNYPANTCAAPKACDGGGVCKSANGIVCATGSDCVTGNCVDGVCCDTSCTGVCKACSVAKGAAANGVCGNIAPGSTDDAPVCGGSNVCNGSGACLKTKGEVCSTASECASGACVDGVCCTAMACGSCQTCNKNIMLAGTCTNIDSGQPDNFPAGNCTGTNVCDGAGVCKELNGSACSTAGECFSGNCIDGFCCDSACNGTCRTCAAASGAPANGTCGNVTSGTQDTVPANACTGTNVCDGTGTCKKSNGAVCGAGNECLSGNCVDGVCCNSTCTSTCQACSAAAKGQGSDGTCGNIVSGMQDNVAASTCVGMNACNGSGVCKETNGSACSTTGECLSNFCADGVCCNAACTGTCDACSIAAGGTTDGTCGDMIPGLEDTNATTVCSGANACGPSGTCVNNKKENGQSCTMANDCASGQCVEGVCCNSACTGTCQSCSVTGNVGMCSPIPAGQPDNVPANTCTGTSACDGAGTCEKANGQTCSTPDECGSGNCVDNVCCNSSCNGVCQACNTAGNPGVCSPVPVGTSDSLCPTGQGCDGAGGCKKLNGQACASAAECNSGHCVDGVCCNGACSGVCEACSAAAKGSGGNGTCQPITSGKYDDFPANTCVAPSACNGAGVCSP
ncbi:MopE-related protein [Polyangium jinanense]|uniref:Uncharacterized protein n=1 Tax=Polyangium jinanense TaxID=2829994 RepID=A0A9X3XBH4_9BACT|nr:MopE-related protein [Polyangium jinanense]MDC3984826.1 hypothetical protein [Polyangium jinanense]